MPGADVAGGERETGEVDGKQPEKARGEQGHGGGHGGEEPGLLKLDAPADAGTGELEAREDGGEEDERGKHAGGGREQAEADLTAFRPGIAGD